MNHCSSKPYRHTTPPRLYWADRLRKAGGGRRRKGDTFALFEFVSRIEVYRKPAPCGGCGKPLSLPKGGPTDQKFTSYTWPTASDSRSQAAQLDPDPIPFIVIPNDGLTFIMGAAAGKLGREFAEQTGLKFGDMGVVIYKGR